MKLFSTSIEIPTLRAYIKLGYGPHSVLRAYIKLGHEPHLADTTCTKKKAMSIHHLSTFLGARPQIQLLSFSLPSSLILATLGCWSLVIVTPVVLPTFGCWSQLVG